MNIETPVVQYKFKCRNAKDLLPYKKEIEKEIKLWQNIKCNIPEELGYLHSLNLFDDDFINEFLLRIDLNDIHIAIYDRNNELNIDVEGRLDIAVFAEVPILAIVNEIYFKHQKVDMKEARLRLDIFNIDCENLGVSFVDMGTRRRLSKKWHETCIKSCKNLSGTSNVFFAMKHNLKCFGSMAHEYLQAFQVLSHNLRNFQIDALNNWLLTFRGKLSTALSDCIGIDAFLNDWDDFFKNNFNTIRHDSGSPFEFIDKVLSHYGESEAEEPNLELLFSDGLTPKTCDDIFRYMLTTNHPFIDVKFGIGTYFTNNTGIEPLQIVMKLTKVNGSPVAKISDSKGKGMCEDSAFEKRLKITFGLK
jgi:nicotinate phosphoribosyltransferase